MRSLANTKHTHTKVYHVLLPLQVQLYVQASVLKVNAVNTVMRAEDEESRVVMTSSRTEHQPAASG